MNFNNFCKSVVFLHRDERWKNMRNYLIAQYTDTYTTLFSGIVIWLICPFMFQVQYVLLGVILSNNPIGKFGSAMSHSVKSMTHQIVLIYDLSLFQQNPLDGLGLSLLDVVRLIVGYALYLLPIGLLLSGFSLFSFNIPLCRDLHAPWLLDNTAAPAPFVLENGESRTLSFADLKTARDWSPDEYTPYGQVAAAWTMEDKPRTNLKLNDITDFLIQYNIAGFHDICIYPSTFDVTIEDKKRCLNTKGLTFCYPGYSTNNSTGEDFVIISTPF